MKFIDLFAGMGGFRVAAESLGLKCVFTSEIDKHAIKVYKDNFGFIKPVDITKFPVDIVPDHDILFGGFPCQAFSIAGKRLGFKENRGVLFFYILRILKVKKPKMFLLENVKGILSHNNGETVKIITDELKALGYDIHTTILNSKDFGVPQSRGRWYCVGFKKPREFQFPVGKKNKVYIKDILEHGAVGYPLDKSSMEILRRFFNNSNLIVPTRTRKRPATRSHGIVGKLGNDNVLRFTTVSTKESDQMNVFYSKNSISDTLITIHTKKLWDLRRYLSPRELLRLQGFPDTFKFNVSLRIATKLTGNSVTVPVIRAIIKQMLRNKT